MNDFCGLCSRAFAVGERTKVRRGVEFCTTHDDDVLHGEVDDDVERAPCGCGLDGKHCGCTDKIYCYCEPEDCPCDECDM